MVLFCFFLNRGRRNEKKKKSLKVLSKIGDTKFKKNFFFCLLLPKQEAIPQYFVPNIPLIYSQMYLPLADLATTLMTVFI